MKVVAIVDYREKKRSCGLHAAAYALLALTSVAMLSAQQNAAPTSIQQSEGSNTGSITGTVTDKDGAVIANATVGLTAGNLKTQTESGSDGSYTFKDVPAGTFEISISAPGFADQTQSGVLVAGQGYIVPPLPLVVATTVEVNVTQTREEIAQEQLHVEEEQRLLGVIPNFYVTYEPDAAPLTKKQKLQLGWKFTIDPVSFAIAGVAAGIEQANNSYPGYGQGAEGFGKRYGAAYADFVSGVFFGNVIFPALFKQDPRYFYKGTGSKKSRLFYALANAVICKGDNGHWQPNYSNVLGSLAAGGLSNLYYPASDRNGIGLTFQNALIGLAGSAGSAVIEEFLLRKVTSHSHDPQ